MSTDTSLIHPLIQPEHLHKLCVGPKISGAAAGKRGRFMQSYGLQVAVVGIFNRNEPNRASKSWEYRGNSAKFWPQLSLNVFKVWRNATQKYIFCQRVIKLCLNFKAMSYLGNYWWHQCDLGMRVANAVAFQSVAFPITLPINHLHSHLWQSNSHHSIL